MSGLGGGLSVGVGVYHSGLSGYSMSSEALTSLESHSHSFSLMSSSSSTATPKHYFQNSHSVAPASTSQSANQTYLRSKTNSNLGLLHSNPTHNCTNHLTSSSSQISLLSMSLHNMSMYSLMQSNMMQWNNVTDDFDEPVDVIQTLLQSSSINAEDGNNNVGNNDTISIPPGLHKIS
jgi:hypothetical protein